ncbi:MAG TPA: LamG domain-containing protein [Kofleriaceae bacterium]|nr:LamG domain-containing protein [Kofleriaceae bacterium]
MKWLALVLSLTGCDALFGLDDIRTEGDAAVTTARYRKRLTVQGTGDLTAFPVLVWMTDPALEAHADPSGRDITFTAGDGTTPLPYEIVSHDGDTIEAWVQLTLSASPTDFYMLYGGSVVQPKASPWTGPFVGVWHLSMPGSIELDRSSHQNDLSSGNAPPAPTQGAAGGAVTFDGTNRMCTGLGDGSLDPGMSSFSFEAWAFVPTQPTVPQVLFERGGFTDGVAGFDLEIGNGNWRGYIADASTTLSAELGAVTPGKWSHLVVVVDRKASLMAAYADGAIQTTTAITLGPSINPTRPLCLGGFTSYEYRGGLDEVRIYNVALSSRWIAAEHDNLASPSTFVIAGDEELIAP